MERARRRGGDPAEIVLDDARGRDGDDASTRASDGCAMDAADAWRRNVERMTRAREENAALSRALAAVDDARAAEVVAAAAAARRARVERWARMGRAPRLRAPTRTETRTAIERVCARVFGGDGGDGAWAPSFGKARRAVEATVGEMSAAERTSVVTEYVMLHVGGSRYRAKCFEEESEEEGGVEDARDVEGAVEDGGEDARAATTAKGEEEDEPARKRGKADTEASTSTIRIVPANEGGVNGITVSVEHRYDWEGRLRVPKMALRDGSETVGSDVASAFLPWWEDVDTRDPRAVGRWGEELVYNYLLAMFPARENHVVEWLNAEQETNSFFDIKVTNVSTGTATFVEVKSTRFDDKNAFEISPWEWDFATKPSVNYHIYRVYNAGDRERVRVHVVRDPAKLVREHRISMALVI